MILTTRIINDYDKVYNGSTTLESEGKGTVREGMTIVSLEAVILVTRPNGQGLAAAPARTTSIDRESVCQNSNDLERTGRGGQLQPVVGRAHAV